MTQGIFFQDLKQVTWHMDAPVAKGQMLARWSLIREASRRGTILLEGQGADECLGGYPSRHTIPYLRTEYEQAGWGALPGALLRGLCAVSTADNRRVLQGILRGALRGKLGLRNKPMSELFSQRARDEPDYVAGDESGNWHLFDDALTNALQQDHGRLVLPHLLHFGDAISMAHSMESRLPFLDHRLVEFVFGLPFQQKICGGQAKFILRKALGADLPKTILARRNKIGFEAPFGNWLRSCFHSEIKPLLCSSTLCNRDIFSDKGLQQLLSQFESTGERALHVLRCASVELWFQQFIDGDGFPG